MSKTPKPVSLTKTPAERRAEQAKRARVCELRGHDYVHNGLNVYVCSRCGKHLGEGVEQ